MTTRCDSCGSVNIIWDDRTGTVLCGDCGLELDRIYFYQSFNDRSEEVVVNYPLFIENSTKSKILQNKFRFFLKRAGKIKNTKPLRIYVELKNDGYNIGHIASKESIEALELLKIDKKLLNVYMKLEKEGWLSGLKMRSRVALTAFLVYRSNRKRLNVILKNLRVNKKQLRKLAKRLPKRTSMLTIE